MLGEYLSSIIQLIRVVRGGVLMKSFGIALLGFVALSGAAVVWQSTTGKQVFLADGTTLGDYWYGYGYNYSSGMVTTTPADFGVASSASTPMTAVLTLYSSQVVPSSGSAYDPYAGVGFGWKAASATYDISAKGPLCITYTSDKALTGTVKAATGYDFAMAAASSASTVTVDLTVAGAVAAATASTGVGFQYQSTPGTTATINFFKIELGACGSLSSSSTASSSSVATSSSSAAVSSSGTSSSSAAVSSSSTTVSSSSVVANPNYIKLWDVSMSNQAKGVGSVPGADTTTLKAGYFYTQAATATVAPASGAPLIASITASNAIGIKVAAWPATVPPYPSASLGLDLYNNGAAVTTRTGKKVLDLTAFGGLCITYNSSDSIAVKVMQQNYVDTWGTDFYSILKASGSKTYVPFATMANPSWATVAQSPAKDFTKVVAIAFAAQGNTTFTMTELGLAKASTDCASMTATTSPATISLGTSSSSTIVASSSSKASSSSATLSSSSKASATLTPAMENGFGFTQVSKSEVRFHTEASREVTLEVFNTTGVLVRSMYQGQVNGDVTVQMKGAPLRTGLYIYRLSSGSDVRVTRAVINR